MNRLLEYTFKASLDEDEDDSFVPDDSGVSSGVPNQQQEPSQNQAPMSDLPQGGVDDAGMDDQSGEDINIDVDADLPDEEMEDVDIDTEQPGDEVIDVTEITTNQDEIKNKVDAMSNQFKVVFDQINGLNDRLEKMFTKTDVKIDSVKTDLTKELEKRVPTDVEKMNLRTLDSGPFKISPNEYWAEKSKDPRYNIYSNNDVSPQDEQEYVLTQKDIDNEPISTNQLSKTLDSDKADTIDQIFKY